MNLKPCEPYCVAFEVNRKTVTFSASEASFLFRSIQDLICWLWYRAPVFYRLGIDIAFPTDSYSFSCLYLYTKLKPPLQSGYKGQGMHHDCRFIDRVELNGLKPFKIDIIS